MIILLFLMLIFARATWLLLQHLQAESELLHHKIIDEMDIDINRALLERCLAKGQW